MLQGALAHRLGARALAINHSSLEHKLHVKQECHMVPCILALCHFLL